MRHSAGSAGLVRGSLWTISPYRIVSIDLKIRGLEPITLHTDSQVSIFPRVSRHDEVSRYFGVPSDVVFLTPPT
jgi:hypothetical protein